jgi:hypothetical protein
MHVFILLTDPLSSLNFSDKLKEQLNGVILVNLMEGTGEPSNPGTAKAVPPVKEEGKKQEKAERNRPPSVRSRAPRKIAKTVSPVHKPVRVAKAPKVESAPVSRQQEEACPEPRLQRIARNRKYLSGLLRKSPGANSRRRLPQNQPRSPKKLFLCLLRRKPRSRNNRR